MSKNVWLTPEEVLHRKKRRKEMIYGSIILGTIILSTFVTLLANKIS